MMDTRCILEVGNQKAYDFVEAMIKSISESFKGRRIHNYNYAVLYVKAPNSNSYFAIYEDGVTGGWWPFFAQTTPGVSNTIHKSFL